MNYYCDCYPMVAGTNPNCIAHGLSTIAEEKRNAMHLAERDIARHQLDTADVLLGQSFFNENYITDVAEYNKKLARIRQLLLELKEEYLQKKS